MHRNSPWDDCSAPLEWLPLPPAQKGRLVRPGFIGFAEANVTHVRRSRKEPGSAAARCPLPSWCKWLISGPGMLPQPTGSAEGPASPPAYIDTPSCLLPEGIIGSVGVSGMLRLEERRPVHIKLGGNSGGEGVNYVGGMQSARMQSAPQLVIPVLAPRPGAGTRATQGAVIQWGGQSFS